MTEKLNAVALGYTGAILGAVCMIVIAILSKIGVYQGLAKLMKDTHLFFSISILGTITGAIEAAVIGFVMLYLIGIMYNKLA